VTDVETRIEQLLERGETEQALELAGAQYTEWLSSGRLAEGRARLQRALDASAAATPARASALLGAGMLDFRQANDDDARAAFEEALAVSREVGDTAQEGRALACLARVALRARDPARVLALAREAWNAYEQVGDRAGVATARHMTAAGTRMTADFRGAAEIYAQSLADARERGDELMVGAETLNLGYMKLHLDDVSAARPLFEESLRVSSRTEDAYLLPYSLTGMGSLALAEGEAERGAKLLAAAKAAFDAGGFAIDPGSDEEFEQGVADARTALGDRFDDVWGAGSALSTDAAVALTGERGSDLRSDP
jgi:tetratricopeptide (TPR) repeat protein